MEWGQTKKKTIWTVFLFIIGMNLYAEGILPVNLRTEYKINPFVDVISPRLSWELTSPVNNQFQSAYQIIVSSSQDLCASSKGDTWDSGKIESSATNQIKYAGKELHSGMRVWWKVRAWDKNGDVGPWSEMAYWEMGLLEKKDWKADWIGLDLRENFTDSEYDLPPTPYLRKNIQLRKEVKSARLYISALGLVEFKINGNKVGNDYFVPGWTDYNERVYYQAYDVTDLIKPGENTLGAHLSYGWYSGYLGYALLVGTSKVRDFYGRTPLMKAQVRIEYTDGSTDYIVSDKDWKGCSSPLIESDMLQGEMYDARKEIAGWDKPGFDDSDWEEVLSSEDSPQREIELYPGNPVRVINEFTPREIIPSGDKKHIVDLGQNFAGIVRLKVKGNPGDTVTLRYGEMLHPDGRLVTENLRRARATDYYILKGDPNGETWMPTFTFHGFQYVEVSGLDEVSDRTITGLALSSDTKLVGDFDTDSPMLNQLYSNIVWTQFANYIDIPTDCPQRDERLGWTGDAQIYVKSATFNTDVAAFYTKWVRDLNDAQWSNGAYPIYAPMPKTNLATPAIRGTDKYSPGWSEAGIICPYEIYETYGDTEIVKSSWENMVAYMEFLKEKSGGDYVFEEGSFEEISPKGGFGDWLSVGKKTPPDLLATMYYAYCAELMGAMADAIGKKEEAGNYRELFKKIKESMVRHYTDESGKFVTDTLVYGDGSGYVDGHLGFRGHTQTAYANAIYMGLVEGEDKRKAGDWLSALVAGNDGKLATGFLGFKPLLPALSTTGHIQTAYDLILSTEYPSLGFEVVNGATSIWERWDSYTLDEGFVHNASMNSFSHYAFGSVCEWMFEFMAGIQVVDPGYRSFSINPVIPQKGLSNVSATYHSINGLIESAWEKTGNDLIMDITVPVNTTANICIPGQMDKITINGEGIKTDKFLFVDRRADMTIVKTGSGKYKIKVSDR